MEKNLSKLEIKDAVSIDAINTTELVKVADFEVAKEKLSNLKNDVAETADYLASINSRISEHLLRMEKLKNLKI